ncbi:MAG TPA: protoporphyrinogen oxidase HemJ [Steroidobacteraceae bacterium]|jgi:putative membrane protein|nr:protoporphyrinogen oxidase HemJ [Steroidobacteraceae bacterium]
MPWLKALHVIFVVTWFAGLFYLPRLFIYHVDAKDPISTQRFEMMERRLFAIMSIGAALSIAFGLLMLITSPGYLQMLWLKVKLLFVALLIAYHAYCHKLMRDLAAQRNTRTAKWLRVFNELPSLLLIVIVILAVVKPF